MNAKPLGYGFSRDKNFQILEATPDKLCKLILTDRLDCSLISSIECFRRRDELIWSKKVGICCETEAKSILYIYHEKNEDSQVKNLLADKTSRSSIALWQILYHEKFNRLPAIGRTLSHQIPENIKPDVGGLLIGDPALQFQLEVKKWPQLRTIDMGSWWYESTGLPFVFALWAYPRRAPIEEHIFYNSMREGMKHISKLVNNERELEYLTKTLHYELTKRDLESLDTFYERAKALKIL